MHATQLKTAHGGVHVYLLTAEMIPTVLELVHA